MEDIIARCAADMQEVAASGKMTLEAQVRAYDLLQYLSEDGVSVSVGTAGVFCSAYEACKDILETAYDADSLKDELEALLAPMRCNVNELRFEAASAASLHEFAKEVWQTWQTAGVFARRRALRDLRERAGFRLESHRIGNYVAKTFDHQNAAAASFAQAQCPENHFRGFDLFHRVTGQRHPDRITDSLMEKSSEGCRRLNGTFSKSACFSNTKM